MVQSQATSAEQYLEELEPERAAVIQKVLNCVRKNIRPGFVESMNWGMISFEVPLEVFPHTYNKKPLAYCSLAAQKRHYAVYLMNVYSGSEYLDMLEKGYEKAGVPLKMGKCCVRFNKLEEVHLPTIAKVIRSCTVEQWLEVYRSCRQKA